MRYCFYDLYHMISYRIQATYPKTRLASHPQLVTTQPIATELKGSTTRREGGINSSRVVIRDHGRVLITPLCLLRRCFFTARAPAQQIVPPPAW